MNSRDTFLSAACAYNAFLGSGKRHLLLTGGRGSGKSTLLAALIGLLTESVMQGLTTRAERGKAVWLRENGTDREMHIGAFDPSLPGSENRMRPLPEGFRELGIPALQRCAARGGWTAVDEIGYLEQSCPEYCSALRELMEHARLLAAVRRQELPFLQELLTRSDVFVVDLDRPFGSLGCVIMASGMGRRFGGNKLMADFGGAPMICRILDATEGCFDRRVVVTRHADVATLCRARGIETILHEQPLRSDTVRLGLEAIGDPAGCMFCPSDQPLLRADTVRALALCAAHDPASIWRVSAAGQPGTPTLFPQWCFPELRELPDGKGGGVLAKKYPERVRYLAVADPGELMDADTQEDLLRLLAAERSAER